MLYDDNTIYLISGEELRRIWHMSEKLCDGFKIDFDERRDMGQEMQLLLGRALEFQTFKHEEE